MIGNAETSLDYLSRRQFLAAAGGSLALTGLGGCAVKPPAEPILPYVRPPEEVVPGRPLYFATAMTLGGFATGVLVESHEGRPTKIEGNPDHPASLGATDAFAQAAVLDLYDPDRSPTITHEGGIRSWDDAAEAIRGALDRQRERQGAGLRILTEISTSPTLLHQMEILLNVFPKARWHQYEPINHDLARAGSEMAFGRCVNTFYLLDAADTVLALDADFLSEGPARLRYVHDFIAKRRTTTPNRLYVAECTPTITGAKADHCWPMRAREVEALARAVAGCLDERQRGGLESPALPVGEPMVRALVRDLQEHRSASAIIPGTGQSPAVHALAHAMNHLLGNVGKTVVHTDPIEPGAKAQTSSLSELVQEMESGKVEMLVIVGGNPVYSAPADLEFADALARVPLRIHSGLYADETAALCHWHIPAAHFLESWSDARAFDGTATILQPLIAPLYHGKSVHELLSLFTDPTELSAYATVRDYWRDYWANRPPSGAAGEFEDFWRNSLHTGLVAGTASLPRKIELQQNWADRLPALRPPTGSGFDLVLRPDPTIYDGRFANNSWLQELPKPLTKLTWDNAALLSPATAAKLGLTVRTGSHGGEHGESRADLIELKSRERVLRVPAWIVPGQPDDAVTLTLGYGRTLAGRIGTGAGTSAYRLRVSTAPWFDTGVEIRRLDETYLLACTQQHHSMDGREPVRVAAGAPHAQSRDDRSAPAGASRGDPKITLYDESAHPYDGYKWGMAIDLMACVGCNACIIACQAENNIPTVGKDQVSRGREMHWLRVDTYRADQRTYFQPIPCMHCENAPCELVCPVEATAHSDEGLNDMVYNRCVGTRYCSNNCPYKVRRFNFLEYADYATASLKLLRNPDVTVRTRGVMEKCTYCVQRINEARIQAANEDRRIEDGDILTACQAACPAQAIAFGDLNDRKSVVSRWKAAPRNYALLGELNTRPRTTYLAATWNPNPEAEGR